MKNYVYIKGNVTTDIFEFFGSTDIDKVFINNIFIYYVY